MERLQGTTRSRGSGLGGTGIAAKEVVIAFGASARGGYPIGAGPPAGGTRSLAEAVVGTCGAPTGNGCAHRCGPTSSGASGSCPRGGRCLWSACGVRQPAAAGIQQLGARGVLPRRRSVPMERLGGTAAPSGPGLPIGGMGSRAKAAVRAYGASRRDGSPKRPGPTYWRDGESCQGGGRCLWSACGGRLPPLARAHQLGGRGVLPTRRSVPMERSRGMAGPINPAPAVGKTASRAQAAVGAYGAPAGDGSP